MITLPIPDNQNTTHGNTTSRNCKVAREFEALFTSMLLKSMRKTVFDNGFIPKSIGERIYTDLLDMEYSKIITNNASFGLAEQIVKQIESSENKKSIMQTLQGIGNQPWMIDPRLIPEKVNTPSVKSLSQRIAHWNTYIDEASSVFNVDRNLIAAVIAQESAGNPYAVSRAGAKGLMQIMDSTAKNLGVKQVFNPRENILAGVKYFDSLLKEFKGNESLALASYNAGPAAVKKFRGVPPYKETQNYVGRVLLLRDAFHQLAKTQNMDNTENGE